MYNRERPLYRLLPVGQSQTAINMTMMILPFRMLRVSSNNLAQCFQRRLVFSVPQKAHQTPVLKSSSSLMKMPSFCCHPFSGFTTNNGQWKYVQYNRVINNGRPSPVMSYSILPFRTTSKRDISEDKETTALTVWQNLKHIKSSPYPALALGFFGLVPFVSAPAYMMISGLYFPQVAFIQLAYGAAILSFLGGVRWGFVISEENSDYLNWFNLGYSVTPPLIAWAGLILPDPLSLFLVMIGLAGTAYFDTVLRGYPPWFKALRFVFSFAAILSIWTVFTCRWFLKSKDKTFQTEEQ